MDILDALALRMMEHDRGDARRIQHFIKVHSLARLIGRGESLDETTLLTLEAVALVHDIGIRIAEEKYGTCTGELQQQEGPEPARRMLKEVGFADGVAQRVAYLVAHHHTYTGVDGADYRILLEADFLVNLYEGGCAAPEIAAAYGSIFRTRTGREMCRAMFGIDEK